MKNIIVYNNIIPLDIEIKHKDTISLNTKTNTKINTNNKHIIIDMNTIQEPFDGKYTILSSNT